MRQISYLKSVSKTSYLPSNRFKKRKEKKKRLKNYNKTEIKH